MYILLLLFVTFMSISPKNEPPPMTMKIPQAKLAL